MITPTVITVSQLNSYVKSIIEENTVLNNVFVEGEVSNFTNHYRSGHFYFTLKDNSAAIRAVMFKGNASRVKFNIEDGMKVIARGRVSVYERDGQYQIIIDDIQPQGIGALSLAFEQMKIKLSKEGLFDTETKKAIPVYPEKIGVITSPTGAAVQDIFNILARRFPLFEIVFCPVEVQGDNAAEKIAKAIERFNYGCFADVLIVGRGGGSIEDLWAFNEEIVARAVYNSNIPVISAVGHETDFTICDFVADLRAPTPSAAAELCVPDCSEELRKLKNVKYTLSKLLDYKIGNERNKLNLIKNNNYLKNPYEYVNSCRITVDSFSDVLQTDMEFILSEYKHSFAISVEKLNALSPLKVLQRGFSFAQTENGKTVIRKKDVTIGDIINLTVSDGKIKCEVKDNG